jgi:tetratricopeptide (TPR) repeat protein
MLSLRSRSTGAWLLLVLLATVACGRSAQSYMDRGNRLFREGKFADAELQYRNAIQQNSKFGEAYLQLGVTLLQLDDAPGAFDAFSHAVELMPSSYEAKVRLADLSLLAFLEDPRRSVRFYTQIIVLGRQILAKDPNSKDGLRFKGALALINRRPEEAVAAYSKANKWNPGQIPIVAGLVEALFEDNQLAEGERVALSFLADHKNAIPIYDLLYRQYADADREKDAEELLKRKIENNPEQTAFRLELAQHYARFHRTVEMTATIGRLLEDPKRSYSVDLQVGDLYTALGNNGEALRVFQHGISSFPQSKVAYQKRIAATLASEGKKDEVAKVIDSILQDQPEDSEALTARATLLLESGRQEDLDPALAQFQALVKRNPGNATLRYNLGRAYLRKGTPDSARAEWRRSADLQRNFIPPRLALTALDLREQNFEGAVRVSEEILAVDQNHAQARLLHAAGLTGTGLYDVASIELKRLAEEFPEWTDVQLQLGILAITQKRLEEAEDIFGKLQRSPRTELSAAMGLAEVYGSEKQFDRAVQLLDAQWKKSPDSIVLVDLLAMTALQAGRPEVAIAAYRKELERFPKSVELRRNLSELYSSTGNTTEAVATAEQWRQLAPADARPEILLAVAYRQAGRTGEMKAHLKRASQLAPEDPFVLNNMAYLLADSGGNLDEAMQLADRAVRRSKGEPHFVDTMGWIYLKKNMVDSALQIFTNLSAKDPTNPAFHYHLGAALAAKGRKDGARTELQAALANAPDAADRGKIQELLAGLR